MVDAHSCVIGPFPLKKPVQGKHFVAGARIVTIYCLSRQSQTFSRQFIQRDWTWKRSNEHIPI
jgi:hypothetical protein